MVTLKQLTYFVALAETGSFSAAADRVHVTQPALSQQIKDMEARLGVMLVERMPRDIRLTRAGQLVLERARQIISLAQGLESDVRLQQDLSGRLRLGVIPTIAPYLLPEALARIRTDNISIDIRVREAQTADLVSAVASGDLDTAIIALPFETQGLVAEPLFADKFLLGGSRLRLEKLAIADTPIRPTELPPDALLLLDEGHCLADQALEVCGLKKSSQKVDLGASSLATLCGMVAQGFGLTFVPELALPSELAASPDMEVTRFSNVEPARMIALVRRSTTRELGWFDQLASLLRHVGGDIITQARLRIPLLVQE